MSGKRSASKSLDTAGRKGIDREDIPGQKENDEVPELVYETVIPGDDRDGRGKVEINPLPDVPELSPKPEKLKN